MSSAATVWLALLLCCSAGLKARGRQRAAAALQTYGVRGRARQGVVLGLLIACELALSIALALQAAWAPGAAAALFFAFAAASTLALGAGRAGQPCACFASTSRLTWSSPLRALAPGALAGALALGWLPSAPSSYERWLTIGLSVAVVAIGVLTVAVLALAREIGVLRLGMAGRGALEIEHEGPALGSRQAWAEAIPRRPRALLLLGVFTSEGCPLCHQVAPALAHVAADPLVAVGSFEEGADQLVWSQARVPGSPYAVALSIDGEVLAKGSFNSLAQLESVLATARARERELPIAA